MDANYSYLPGVSPGGDIKMRQSRHEVGDAGRVPFVLDLKTRLVTILFSTSRTSLKPTLPLLALFRTLLIKTVTSLSLTQSNVSLSFIGLLKPATNVLSSWLPGLKVNSPPTFNPCGTEMKTLLSLLPTLLSIAPSSPLVFNRPMTS